MHVNACTLSRAQLDDLNDIAMLFDQYRQFYQQEADLETATRYIQARLEQQESVIFIARDTEGRALGFCQLYPTFCSVAAAPILVLYDLFVAEAGRRSGVGRALMLQAQQYGKQAGVAYMALSTAKDNLQAQALYASLGWQRDNTYYVYTFA
jgi:ribosomal protein S18 acetylase RimI-like enzyme